MINFTYVLTAVLCIVELSLIYPFVKSMIPQKTAKSLLLKMICSTSFLLIGFLTTYSLNVYSLVSKYPYIILTGLCLSWAGDLLLGLNGSKVWFITGGVFFLLTHFCYITAFSYVSLAFFERDGALGLFEICFCLILVLLFEIYNRKKGIKLGKLHIPVLIYALVLTTMLSKSIVLAKDLLSGGEYCPAALIFSGALLFFISDFTLTYTILEEKRKTDIKYKFINSLSYFAGQTLIALSIIFIK